jgi:hypothetical protein
MDPFLERRKHKPRHTFVFQATTPGIYQFEITPLIDRQAVNQD